MAPLPAMNLPIIHSIAAALLDRGWTMATAESCTGGGIAAACTDVPGSSQWFAGAVVAYTIPWKERLLGVPAETIGHFGVVSHETVAAMLHGLQERHGVQAGIAVSGIAGPTGAEPGKPVGTVVLGAIADAAIDVRTFHFPGDRLAVRAAAVTEGLRLLDALLSQRRCSPRG